MPDRCEAEPPLGQIAKLHKGSVDKGTVMDGIVVAFFVPAVIFMVLVAPAWVWQHYRSKQRALEGLAEQERDELETLVSQAEEMQERIATLESILDAKSPTWRHNAS